MGANDLPWFFFFCSARALLSLLLHLSEENASPEVNPVLQRDQPLLFPPRCCVSEHRPASSLGRDNAAWNETDTRWRCSTGIGTLNPIRQTVVQRHAWSLGGA